MILHWNSLFAHENNGSNNEIFAFKEQINDLCSGHGLMHLENEQIEKICDQFSENSADVLALMESAPTDKYLVQLTGLIIRANLPKGQKDKLLRKSYEISLAHLSDQEEWSFTIGLLMEDTKILTQGEAQLQSNSKNAYLRSVSKKYLESLRSLYCNEHIAIKPLTNTKAVGGMKYFRNLIIFSIVIIITILFIMFRKKLTR